MCVNDSSALAEEMSVSPVWFFAKMPENAQGGGKNRLLFYIRYGNFGHYEVFRREECTILSR